MKQPGAIERLSANAALAAGGTPAEFAKFIATEQRRWKLVIARAKIKSDRVGGDQINSGLVFASQFTTSAIKPLALAKHSVTAASETKSPE